MTSIQELIAHRHEGWQGQYSRMIRWVDKYKQLALLESQASAKTHLYFDTLYACFQNIFFLKDWLIQDAHLSVDVLNTFTNANKEIGICRDICNGTKHYNINNASVDKSFGIIKQYNPYHKVWGTSEYEIIICAGGDIYKPYDLVSKCVDLWDKLISDELDLGKVGYLDF